jgi:hypothetical protein
MTERWHRPFGELRVNGALNEQQSHPTCDPPETASIPAFVDTTHRVPRGRQSHHDAIDIDGNPRKPPRDIKNQILRDV